MQKFDVLIIGGGISGLSTAHSLSLQKGLKIGILEQFTLGHEQGSSHGTSRIIRSTYVHPVYLKLMRRVQQEMWPAWEKELQTPLIVRSDGCFFGKGALFEQYSRAIASSGLDIKELDLPSARRLFPQFRFQGVSGVLLDRTGGVIAAKETMEALARQAVRNGVSLFEKTQALAIDSSQDPIQVVTNRGVFFAEKLVVTAGPWMGKLIPSLSPFLTPIRQFIGYFQLCGAPSSYEVGRFPTWAYIGEDQLFFGLPSFGHRGIKVCQHVTRGKRDDPDDTQPDEAPLQILQEFIKSCMVEPIDRVLHTETCFYTNTPKEDFLLGLLPTDSRIAVGSACSGHGFKFAPLVGLVLSDLILHGKTTLSEFEEAHSLFSLNGLSKAVDGGVLLL